MIKRILSITALLVAFTALPAWAADFSTSLLEGTWPGYILETNGTSPFRTAYASTVFQSNGDIVSGTLNYSDGESTDFNDGALVLEDTGGVNGRFTTVEDRELTVRSGKMVEEFESFALTYRGSDVTKGLFYLLDASSDFEEKDFDDDWTIMAVETDGVTIKPQLLQIRVDLDDDGETNSGTYEYMEGEAGNVSSMDLNITADGRVVGSIELGNGVTITIRDASMSDNNTIISGVFTHSDGNTSTFIMLAEDGGHGGGDFDGNWFGYFAENQGDQNFTPFATFRMDEDNVDTATFVYQNGDSFSFDEGDFDITGEGEVTGDFTTDDALYTIMGWMDEKEELMALFYTSDAGHSGFTIMVKEAGSVDDGDGDDDDDEISGCVLSPKAAFDVSWLLLMALPAVAFLRRR